MTQTFIQADPYQWPHDGNLDPRTTALLIIDMQEDFCASGGYVDSMGYDLTEVLAIIPNVLMLRQVFREWGGLVVYTREGHKPDLSDLLPLKQWRSQNAGIGIGAQGPLGRLLVRDEPGWQIIPELTPQPGEPVVDKVGYSAFFGTDLDIVLRARSVSRLVLTGATTDICVHSTLRDAVERGYECLLVEDACAATDPANHAAAVSTAKTEGGIFGAVTIADHCASGLMQLRG